MMLEESRPQKNCCDCGINFYPITWNHKRCSGCGSVAAEIHQRAAIRRWKAKARVSGWCPRCEKRTGKRGMCDSCKEYVRAWKKRNAARICGYRSDRGKEPSRNGPLRSSLLLRQGGVCVGCGTSDGPWHLDHILPVCRGGETVIENLQVLCATCNLRKGGKLQNLGVSVAIGAS